jgi:hypothetical protein
VACAVTGGRGLVAVGGLTFDEGGAVGVTPEFAAAPELAGRALEPLAGVAGAGLPLEFTGPKAGLQGAGTGLPSGAGMTWRALVSAEQVSRADSKTTHLKETVKSSRATTKAGVMWGIRSAK